MSSSVFTESNVLPKTQDCMSSDSNLVVVYGKNGISFDQRGLENIIEEKSISTISVVRLTSPTPSMEDEEETERLEELERQLNEASDDSEGDTEDGDGTCNEENKSDRDHVTGEDNESSQEENNEENTDEEAPKVRKKPGRKPKIVKKQKKRRKPKERPEIVGLRVEQFYKDDIANELVKNALKIAGLPIFKRTPATDALLEVIKNDHNYTPFTSAEQMRAQKAAERLEAERRAAQSRKLLPHTSSNVRQLVSKKKLQLQQQQPQTVVKEKKPQFFDRLIPTKVNRMSKPSKEEDDLVEDDDDVHSSLNADDDDQGEALDTNEEYDESDISVDSRVSDNDRESDIDFNVNNRSATKRKRRKKSKRNQQIAKQQQQAPVQKPLLTKRLKQPPEQNLTTPVVAPKPNPIISASPGTIRPIKVSAPQIVKIVHISKPTQPAEVANKKVTTPTQMTPVAVTTPHKTSIVGVRRVPMPNTTPSSNNSLSARSPHLASQQDVKEIVINKNLNSPKGVFTNLNTFLNESSNTTTTTPFPTTPKSRNSALATSTPTQALPTQRPTKGFMPLGVDTATSNKLPAQISIQTHQSSSEIAAENERQLDLIDSIVQDELQKPSLIEQQPTPADENIPKLVKMLESTAEVLDQQNIPVQPGETTRQLSSFTANLAVSGPNVNDIDIANAPLLQTPDDDIPVDFLKHVVDLIEDDKKFKEEVEKEVFGVPFSSEQTDNIGLSIGQPSHADINALTENQEKSTVDIKTQIARQDTQISIAAEPCHSNAISGSNLQNDSISGVRNSNPPFGESPSEPVQIVRGNGRVITLPPIEAPTTRAKRRAQATPGSSGTDVNSTIHSESSLDGSVYSNASYAGNESLSQLQLSTKRTAENSGKRQLQKESTLSMPPTLKGGRKRNVSAKKELKEKQIKSVDAEASESQEDDDDPKKLWCICRQPHNNRFMICCDICEDWFHGTCVNITKAMGREMELKGTDWTCPKCVQKQEEKKQPRITEMLQKNSNNQTQNTITPQKPNDESTFKKTSEKIDDIEMNQSSEQSSLRSDTITPVKTLSIFSQKKDSPTIGAHLKRVEVSANVDKQPMSPSQKPQTKVLHQQQLKFVKVNVAEVKIETTPCIVCKKPSRQNSIYCSDECIRKYAQLAIQTHQTTKTPEKANTSPTVVQDGKKGKKKDLFEDMLLLADSVTKGEKIKISVFERKSGRVICGQNAPTALNLKKWLQENPTFEVVQPGSVQAQEIEKRQIKRAAQTSSPTVNKIDISSLFKSAQRLDESADSPPPLTPKLQKHAETISAPQATKSSSITTPENQMMKMDKTDTPAKNKVLNRQQSESISSSHKTEPIRVNVRRTLKEQLLLRMKETQEAECESNSEDPTSSVSPKTHNTLSIPDVEQFAKNVESEMYNLFSKDTGAKYKAKYRSLMFNIKDRKNKTLFAKICAKEITPKQLVRMTPEELASQELAMWRENENKHQLEIIKKSELDLLACNKNYVLKTHKGEEVIEGKNTDFSNLDLSLPAVDEIVGENVPAFDENCDAEAKKHELEHSGSQSNKQASRDKEKENGRDKEREKKHKSHKDKDHHRHRSRGKSHSRKRSLSHSKSRSRSHEKRQKTAYRDDRHHSSHERHRDRESDHSYRDERHHGSHERKRDKESEHQGFQHEATKRNSPEHTKDRQSEHKAQEVTRKVERNERKPEQETLKSLHTKHATSKSAPADNFAESCNLVDQILNSVKTVEEAAKLVKTSKEKVSHETETCMKDDPYMEYMKNISTTAIWRGDLNMVDVSCFHVTMHTIVGNSQNIAKIFQERIEAVGRIYKETVWEYISKIKKSPTKEVVIVSLFPTNDKDIEGYRKLFEYLDTRQRLGVIGVRNAHIRDFYIYPFNNRAKLPPVLQTSDRVDFYDDVKRPDVLLGIIIRCITKRSPIVHHGHAIHSSSIAKAKLQRFPQKHDTGSFTPPGSPNLRRISDARSSKDDEIDLDAIIKAPIVSKSRNSIVTPAVATTKNDGDEPYSPGDSSEDEVTTLSAPEAGGEDDELKRKVEEINKQIVAQRKEIAGLLNVNPSDLDVPSTSTSVLSKISIPPNLSTILASIKEKTFTPGVVAELPSEEEYNPEDAIVSSSSYARAKRVEKPTTSSSRLAQLSEAELLSMVPDDIDAIPPIEKRSEEPPPPGV